MVPTFAYLIDPTYADIYVIATRAGVPSRPGLSGQRRRGAENAALKTWSEFPSIMDWIE